MKEEHCVAEKHFLDTFYKTNETITVKEQRQLLALISFSGKWEREHFGHRMAFFKPKNGLDAAFDPDCRWRPLRKAKTDWKHKYTYDEIKRYILNPD